MAKSNGKAKTTKTSASSRSKKTKSSLWKAAKATASRKKLKTPFNVGDLVTGKDRSYKRSIYKLISTTEDPKMGLFEFQSLGLDVVERWKDAKASVNRYQMLRLYEEFRLARKDELEASTKARVTYFLMRLLNKLTLNPDSISM